MALVHRRVFHAKPGMSSPLVEHIHEFAKMAAAQGTTVDDRILTDYLSGRTDRVVWEWTFDDWGHLESAMAMGGSEAGQAALTAWERTMNGMIDYAEVENWSTA
jgi:hypothetical protein